MERFGEGGNSWAKKVTCRWNLRTVCVKDAAALHRDSGLIPDPERFCAGVANRQPARFNPSQGPHRRLDTFPARLG